MSNLINEFHGKRINIKEVSTAAFENNNNVSVLLIEVDIKTDFTIKDIRYLSVNEGSKQASIIPSNNYILNDNSLYVILINHPSGIMTPSHEDIIYYKYLKSKYPTFNIDMHIVSKDTNTYLTVNRLFDLPIK